MWLYSWSKSRNSCWSWLRSTQRRPRRRKTRRRRRNITRNRRQLTAPSHQSSLRLSPPRQRSVLQLTLLPRPGPLPVIPLAGVAGSDDRPSQPLRHPRLTIVCHLLQRRPERGERRRQRLTAVVGRRTRRMRRRRRGQRACLHSTAKKRRVPNQWRMTKNDSLVLTSTNCQVGLQYYITLHNIFLRRPK